MAAAVQSLSKGLPNVDPGLEATLQQFASRTAFTITSSREPDMPIIYVSHEFCKMTAYKEDEILGNNLRFLQGPGTSRQAVQEIRNGIQEDRGCTVCLMNYTKDGKPFWNQMCMAPVHDESGISCYLSIHTNVTGEVLAYRSQQFSPFQTKAAGPHGGVHSFTCPEIVKAELEAAKKLERSVKRWHSEKLMNLSAKPTDFRPVSSKCLPSSLLAPLHRMHQSFVLADPKLPDMPIVHASEGFLRMTGRPRNEVVGHNCRFMQGPLTDQQEVQRLRDAIKEERPITVRLLNYKTTGEVFWNHLHVAPIRNADGKVVFYVGCQLDITVKPDRRHSESSSFSKTAENLSKSEPKEVKNSSIDHEISTIPESQIEEESVAAHKEDGALDHMKTLTKSQSLQKEDLLSVLHGAQTDTVNKGAPNTTAASQQLPEAIKLLSPASKQQQRSVIGTVRVVCRSLSTTTGLRRSLEDQHLPHGVDDCGSARKSDISPSATLSGLRFDMPTLKSSHI